MREAHEGPLFVGRPNEDALMRYLNENGLACMNQPFAGAGQVGRFRCLGDNAIVLLYASGKAVIQGKPSAAKKSELSELLRVALWEVK